MSERFRDEWKFWSTKLEPQKFVEEKPIGVSDEEWKRMKRRFSWRRFKEVTRAKEELTLLVVKMFIGKVRDRLKIGYLFDSEELDYARSILESVLSATPDPDDQFDLLQSIIDTYLDLYLQFGHSKPTIVGMAKTLKKNPAFLTVSIKK